MIRLMDEMIEEEDWYYAVRFDLEELRLTERYEDEYAIRIEGTIVQGVEPDGRQSTKVGHLSAVLFRGRDLINNHESAFDTFDAVSHDTLDLYGAIYDSDSDSISDAVFDMFVDFECNVLALLAVGVEPEHRGRGVGQAAVARLIQTFGGGALVVLRNFPQRYKDGRFDHLPPEERIVVQARRKQLWINMGFRPSPLTSDEAGFMVGSASDMCWTDRCQVEDDD